jgi:hypothetical protein
MKRAHILRPSLTLLLAAFVACSDSTEPPAAGSIEISALVQPIPVLAEGRYQLVYELIIRNFGAGDVDITRLEVLDGQTQLASYQGAALGDLIELSEQRLERGERGAITLWLEVDTTDLPSSLLNRVTFEGGGASLDQELIVEVDDAQPVALGPPLLGDDWLASNISNDSHHRRALLTFSGELRVPQRFAIDWIRVGAGDQSFSGDPLENPNYHAYGAEVLAVADGTVVRTNDGVDENIPGETPGPDVEPGGNFVVLDLGGGQQVLYAHLIPGSLRVQTGEAVNRGDVIGLLGNSGNSTEPHLHFHVARTVNLQSLSALDAIGLPFVHASFVIQRNRPVLGERQLELPLDRAILQF